MDRLRLISFTCFHFAQPNAQLIAQLNAPLIAQHTGLVKAIKSGSPAVAVNHIQKHPREILASLPVIFRENPDFFDSANDETVSFSTVALAENLSGDINVS